MLKFSSPEEKVCRNLIKSNGFLVLKKQENQFLFEKVHLLNELFTIEPLKS